MAMTDGSAAGWSDGKRYLWLLGALTITLPILAAQLALSTGLHVFWWFMILKVIKKQLANPSQPTKDVRSDSEEDEKPNKNNH